MKSERGQRGTLQFDYQSTTQDAKLESTGNLHRAYVVQRTICGCSGTILKMLER